MGCSTGIVQDTYAMLFYSVLCSVPVFTVIFYFTVKLNKNLETKTWTDTRLDKDYRKRYQISFQRAQTKAIGSTTDLDFVEIGLSPSKTGPPGFLGQFLRLLQPFSQKLSWEIATFLPLKHNLNQLFSVFHLPLYNRGQECCKNCTSF